MKKIFAIFLILMAVSGCGFLQQAKDDYRTGKETPYQTDEITANQKAAALAGTISSVPYANVASPVILLLGPYIFTWLRGRRIRQQNLEPHPNPITGNLGKSIGAEALIQHLANVAAGMFEVGEQGSVIKRGWKGALLAGLGVLVAPEVAQVIHNSILPVLQNTPPDWLAHLFNGSILALTIGGLAAAEKWLSKVQPLKPVNSLPIAA